MTKNVVIRILPEQRKTLSKLGRLCSPKLTASQLAIHWIAQGINDVRSNRQHNTQKHLYYAKTTTN